MEYSSVFLRIRTIAFSCIMFTSFLWIVLLSLVVFSQWELSDQAERSLIIVLLLANTITLIMLLILLLRPFRPWLDAARCLFLLVAHIGTAGAFAYWSPTFSCPLQILIYAGGLALMVHRHSCRKLTFESDTESVHVGRPSLLPMMQPSMSDTRSPLSLQFPPDAMTKQHHSDSTRSSYQSTGGRKFSIATIEGSGGNMPHSSISRYSVSSKLAKPARISTY
ncbi:hypothetical protein BDQ12DRAFT_662877 [Crucibulum laeve]|uniref:Uncharacterized protein n=1 Tax=Crucibulum laeve TaxID=68775 RepID=A0A5C3MDI1_9AGAR|nr:hypothetical protein BDQ12DRAFT_662877 [Crucibulum laeve]